jgi:antitoxin MazE
MYQGEYMAHRQVVKWGNSLAVRIFKPIAEEEGVREGDPIVVEATPGRIRLQRVECIPALKELVARITPENPYQELRTRRAPGKEAVEW